MIFSVLAVALFAQAALAAPFARRAVATPDEIARLAPDLGSLPNTNPNQGGDCDGPRQLDGKIPRVPCQCPPLHDAYIQALTTNVLAGHAVNNTVVNVDFPVGDSLNDKHGRITAAIIALQNLNGPGKGCPGVSTTLGIQSKNLDTCGDFFCDGSNPSEAAGAAPATGSATETTTAPDPNASSPGPTEAPAPAQNNGSGDVAAGSTVTITIQTVVTSTQTVTRGQETGAASDPAATTSAASNGGDNGGNDNGNNNGNDNNNGNNGGNNNGNDGGANNGVLTRDLVDQLAPELGSQPNNNPNQFGDCDGPQQPDGKIPRVPCQCPPTRDVYIDQLFANIQAGHALKNPSVNVNFPLGNSKDDQHARITAAVIALQNLDGPGKGCPGVSTTFAAQNNAIDAA